MTVIALPQDSGRAPARIAAGLWLAGVAVLIAAMVLAGGLTRLTGSGLSITQWQPIAGVIPPLTHAAWAAEFAHYRQIPQYRLENAGMTLSQFQAIFWWEWSHRLLGRIAGLAFLLPFLFFAWRGDIPRKDYPRMIGLFALGGLQGVVGWWMVKSGLEVRTSVSQYRLAIHLGVALILYAAILWTALEYLRPKTPGLTAAPHARWALVFAGCVYLQMLLGAIVAGLHAGLVYNTWPSMNGRWTPENPFFAKPWYVNFFEDAGLAQFDHRLGAYLIFIASLALFWAVRNDNGPRKITAHALLGLVLVQIALGIFTLLYQVPVGLAAAHQLTAVALFTAALWHAYEATAPTPLAARA